MEFEVTPYKLMGLLEFNMTKENVRNILKSPFVTDVTSFDSSNLERDMFDELGIFTNYDNKGLLRMISVFNEENNKLFYKNKDLLNMSFYELILSFSKIDDGLYLDDEKFNLFSPMFGLQFFFLDLDYFLFTKGDIKAGLASSTNINIYRDIDEIIIQEED